MNFSYKDIESFSIFFSAQASKLYLKNCYEGQNITNAEQLSFENCYRFIYFLKHGQLYYKQAEIAPLQIKPTLLFYGLINIIKGSILTIQPDYPKTTAMLAHGVSTRKRKRQNYSFLNDEVKIQENGLFSIIANDMYKLENINIEKIKMKSLLENIAEFNSYFEHFYNKKTFTYVKQNKDQYFSIDDQILDYYYMTENRFKKFIKGKCQTEISFVNLNDEDKKIHFKIEDLSVNNLLPFKLNLLDNKIYLPLKNEKLSFYPELLLHYLLLYNLSMIARYETEWWNELIYTMPNLDYPFIQHFLQLTTKKGPFLLFNFLTKQFF